MRQYVELRYGEKNATVRREILHIKVPRFDSQIFQKAAVYVTGYCEC
jgi:hypothetical protein